MPKKEEIDYGKLSLALIRHLLGSIDLSDVELEEKEMSKEERKAYCAAIFAVWPRLEKDLKRFLHTQLMFGNNKAEIWDQVLVSRGTFNGIDLLYQWWKNAATEFESMPKEEKETFDKTKVMPEI